MDSGIKTPSVVELQVKPTTCVEHAILGALFRNEYLKRHTNHFGQYLKFYQDEVAKLRLSRFRPQACNVVVSTHQELIELISVVKATQPLTRNEVITAIKTRFASVDELSMARSLNLVLKLWLSIDDCDSLGQLAIASSTFQKWSHGQELSDCLKSLFPISRGQIEARNSRLHPSFTAIFMIDVCGLELEWTSCLVDHLRLNRRRKRLQVFSDKAFIAAHLDAVRHFNSGTDYSPFPEQLLIETLWSLNLLFPHWDERTNHLLERHRQRFHEVEPYEGPPTLNLIEFDYWRERLSELYDVVFLAPPVSWAQLFKDRRNPQQYWTFWIALVILLLTVISTIASVIQAVVAFR